MKNEDQEGTKEYELISSLIDNELQSQQDVESAIDILLSDNKYSDFWRDCHIIKDSLNNVDNHIEDFFNSEINSKKSKFIFNKIINFNDNVMNIFKPVAIVMAICFLCLGIWGVHYNFFGNDGLNDYSLSRFSADKNILNDNIIMKTSNNDIFYITNKVLKNISYYFSSNSHVLSFEKYLSNVLYKFDMEVEAYIKKEGIENTDEIITSFFLYEIKDDVRN